VSRISRAYYLLILNGHGSYAIPKFNQYCAENKIITLCMPTHTLHLLQPLDVGCFSSLKVAYGRKIGELARQGIFHINKEEFFYVYLRVRVAAISEQNIQSGFRATGLIPYDPQRVLTSLTIIRTPSPPGIAASSEAV